MPLTPGPGPALHYRVDGPEDAPALVLSNSLGSDLSMWEEQIPALAQRYRMVRYDTRGHGGSEVTPGPYTLEQLGQDVLRLLDHLGLERAHFCGLSMGGLTGLWLGRFRPARLRRLIVCNSAARVGSAASWAERIAKVQGEGMAALADTVVPRWFSAPFYAAQPARMAQLKTVFGATLPAGYMANCAALADADLRGELGAIQVPTLVIGGTHDLSTPQEQAHELVRGIPGARGVILEAGHLSNIEQAERFNTEVLAHLDA